MKRTSYKPGRVKYVYRGQPLTLSRIAELTGIPRGTLTSIARNSGAKDITESVENALARRRQGNRGE